MTNKESRSLNVRSKQAHHPIPVTKRSPLTGREHSGDDSASLRTGNGLQLHRVLRGGAELSHVVGDGGRTQHHLLGEKSLENSTLKAQPDTKYLGAARPDSTRLPSNTYTHGAVRGLETQNVPGDVSTRWLPGQQPTLDEDVTGC